MDPPEAAGTSKSRREPSWDLGLRLAKEIGFTAFEAGGTYYFGKPSWLAGRVPQVKIAWSVTTGHEHLTAVPSLRDNDDDKQVTGTLRPTTVSDDVPVGAVIDLLHHHRLIVSTIVIVPMYATLLAGAEPDAQAPQRVPVGDVGPHVVGGRQVPGLVAAQDAADAHDGAVADHQPAGARAEVEAQPPPGPQPIRAERVRDRPAPRAPPSPPRAERSRLWQITLRSRPVFPATGKSSG
ncbi:hypothetical protein DI270_004975 [Microbispora triticiradicis]|uniref:Uncharacterized protein n=1 Tax=Microbispora triticiradicis TaxID=2200763 RepID=A0ABX9LT05_9ACTN|nr:hypothetical protein [Microbispora triticiradicis]RGA06119.1 hypothetical protein DI270_004975 [Microbispora triticiradicis]GLW20484.1 hypothetical protein Mame01_05270 [Microbispora amethystogenes]